MKLLAKTGLIYFVTTLFVFASGGVVFYYNLRKIVDEETTERLFTEKSQVEDFVKEHDTIPGNSFTEGDELQFFPMVHPPAKHLRDTIMFSKEEGEDLPFRQLVFPIKAGKGEYSVLISKNLFETDDLVEAISWSFITIIIVLLVVTVIVNRIAAGKIMKPFFSTVGKLKEFKLEEKEPVSFSKTSTKEFRELNRVLEKMTEKITTDYRNLKSFTENASHELQTPLSVILASTEQLLQEKNLDERSVENIQRINQTTRKLSKLNQTLLLLAKIENRQFDTAEETDLSEILKSRMELLGDIIAHKEIKTEMNVTPHSKVKIHQVLAEVLVSNLLTNAIRHNVAGGKLLVNFDGKKLIVANTGAPLQGPPEKLFERFYKENNSTESTGLGLALVKQIADTYSLILSHNFENGVHSFTIGF
ncbi:MAG: HAMP domain-containing histidine kinase [Bacteroidetes bacterium]|nr:HAMP domain-containing histidine kinase [Bacteroidota bacterium]